MCGPSLAAMPATGSCRHRHHRGRSIVGSRDRVCSHMYWYRSMPIINRSTGSRRFTLAKASTWIVRHLLDWVGATSELLSPVVEAVRDHVMSASKLHADDTPDPVLAPGNGQDQYRTALDLCPRRPAIGRYDRTRRLVRRLPGPQGREPQGCI